MRKQQETLKKLLSKMEYSITETKEDGDKAVVTADITAVDIQLKKADDSWKIQLSDELLDAILGGLISYGNELNDAFDQ